MTERTRHDAGATAVEFAIVLPLLLTLIGSLLALGLHMTYAALAQHAANIGLRTAVVPTAGGGYPSDAQVRARLASSLGGVLPAPQPEPVLDDPATGSRRQGDPLTVRVTYQVPVVSAAARLVPVPGLRSAFDALGSVTGTARGRRE
jgi:Flp pilus assembly protein TadG